MITLPSKRYETIIDHNTETTVVPASGGRKTILRIDGKAGIIRQITYQITELETRMIVRIDNEYEVVFPTATTLLNHWFTIYRIKSESVFLDLAKFSPYSVTSTISMEFNKSVEVIILNIGSVNADLNEIFLIAEILRDDYLNEQFILEDESLNESLLVIK